MFALHFLAASLPNYLTASLPHCLTASIPHYLTASLSHCLTVTLPHLSSSSCYNSFHSHFCSLMPLCYTATPTVSALCWSVNAFLADHVQTGLLYNRLSKCLNHHNQRLCKILLAGVSLLLQTDGVWS